VRRDPGELEQLLDGFVVELELLARHAGRCGESIARLGEPIVHGCDCHSFYTVVAMDDAFEAHYATGIEQGRLTEGSLELNRTLELLERFLPPPPADVLDVGGGPGVYAGALTDRGYRVRLVDALALHVEHARRDGRFEADVGDARSLDAPDERYDAVLLMGPLYHLTDRGDRLKALAEARRVLRTGGLLLAVAVSRYSSLFDGFRFGRFENPGFKAVVERDLTDGQHRNDRNVAEWFTTAFFHHPDELETEVREAGFELDRVIGIEGPGSWFAAALDVRVWAARVTEGDDAIRAVSSHLLAVARKS
jgi:SAM-dependent methyltransferase